MEEAGAAKAKGTEAPSPTTTAMASTSSSWVVEMEKLLGVSEGGSSGQSSVVAQMVRQQEGHSIYRVPEYIKDMTNRKAYEPQLVSLGPFHYGEPPLLPMEVHKRRAVAHMVNRSGKPLQKFVSAVEEISEQLRNAYENLDETKWPEQRFVELMVTDGCFSLEIMRTFWQNGKVAEEDYGPKDPVFSQHGWLHVLDHIMSDMVVMENQVPLLLIKKLMFVAQDTYDFQTIDDQINEMVVEFLSDCTTITPAASTVDDKPGLHVLDILHKNVSGTHRRRQGDSIEPVMPSATELHEAGVHFKVSNSCGFAGAVSFQEGVLSIPQIQFYDHIDRMLLNLMVLEKLHPCAGNGVMAFLILMDNLINTTKDVALLKSKGIIENGLGSDEAVANLMNSTLTNGSVMSPDSGLHDVLREVNAYCKKPWNSWRASLIHTYFSNPWVFISLVAATALLTATLMQTVYTVMPFYKKG